jgi:hypothetical protein
MLLIACIEEPDVAKTLVMLLPLARKKILKLEHLGLRAEPLSTLRARAPPSTLELFPAA